MFDASLPVDSPASVRARAAETARVATISLTASHSSLVFSPRRRTCPAARHRSSGCVRTGRARGAGIAKSLRPDSASQPIDTETSAQRRGTNANCSLPRWPGFVSYQPSRMTTNELLWYVAHSRPRCEKKLAEYCGREGLQVTLPCY